jgi:signal transduction histidine kinase
MYGRISLRYKIPINLSLAILLTGLVIGGVLIWRSYEEVRNDLFRSSVELGTVLARTLVAPLKHDDVWKAYQILRSAGFRVYIVLDDQQRVFVSNEPTQFPMLAELRTLGPEFAALQIQIENHAALTPFLHERLEDERLYVVIPVVDDGIQIAHVVIGYPRTIYWPHLLNIAERVGLTSLIVMLFLIPIGWWVGNRTVDPLVQLSQVMSQVGSKRLEDIDYKPLDRDDEIGQLGQSFDTMIEELREKQNLEGQVIVSERLAAIGRLAAGVAHEINNPLGGMMNAVNTYRRFGRTDNETEKTMFLLERGLKQIHETVSALLVEARQESHDLTPEDIEDVRLLVQSDAQKKGLRLVWDNKLDRPLSLPSTPVRQVLMNLSLNAVQAAAQAGQVTLSVARVDGVLEICVSNDGVTVSKEEIGHLFEPFVYNRPGGTGLGLWITYQIVRQFGGDIYVQSEHGSTSFMVHLPLELVA